MKQNKRHNNNLKNAIIAILVPFPSIIFYLSFLHNFNNNSHHQFLFSIYEWCYRHPFLLVNVLFFFNVNVLFWVIGHFQSSHWLIDPYWTVIPVMFVHYYATHPLARYDEWRSKVVILLTWVWSLRLTHSYFRREKWQWGVKQDWRFTDMSQHYASIWWWLSFFAIYLSQQVFLIGLSLPLYIVHTVEAPWSIWDAVAVAVCVTGIIIAFYADTQLHAFVTKNDELKACGKPVEGTLEFGLWKYSRHPNYFGEQLWWWGVGIFGWKLGHGWALMGALVNTLCLAYVTILVEERMVRQPFRAEAYRRYQKTTSVWIPWFKSSSIQDSKDKIN